MLFKLSLHKAYFSFYECNIYPHFCRIKHNVSTKTCTKMFLFQFLKSIFTFINQNRRKWNISQTRHFMSLSDIVFVNGKSFKYQKYKWTIAFFLLHSRFLLKWEPKNLSWTALINMYLILFFHAYILTFGFYYCSIG